MNYNEKITVKNPTKTVKSTTTTTKKFVKKVRTAAETKRIALERDYREGRKTPESLAAHADKCRAGSKKYMRKCYATPETKGTLSYIYNRQAGDRVTKASLGGKNFTDDLNVALCELVYQTNILLNKRDGKGSWQVDHIIPIAMGGNHHFNNLQNLTTVAHKEKTKHERRAILNFKKQLVVDIVVSPEDYLKIVRLDNLMGGAT